MGEIINLSDRRKKDTPSLQELIETASSFIAQDWERYAKINRLNDYFVDATAACSEERISYLNDLNSISAMEQKLGMRVVVKSPLHREHLGWRASFALKTATVTSLEMPFETYARCFSILLFIKLKRDLLAAGMADEL